MELKIRVSLMDFTIIKYADRRITIYNCNLTVSISNRHRRLPMNHFQKYLADEFAEEYQEGRLSRRDALKMIASVTGSLLLANSILAACAPSLEENAVLNPTEATSALATEAPTTGESSTPTTAPAGTVMPDDPAVIASEVDIPTELPPLRGYMARPAGQQSAPVILICHENRGLTPHIQDVTRRFAKAGYAALAVDLVSRHGGSAEAGEGNVPGILGGISPDQFVSDFVDGWKYIGEQPFAQAERVGMAGFCFGGGVTWLMAARMPELRAAVPFYGPHPPLEEVPNIQAAVRAIYGELDGRINGGIPAIEQAMQENNKVFEAIVYPNADHAFHNDTGSRYNAEAATDAWSKTLEWFATYV
jgi:carboxymethylenebutenolidase